MSIDCKAEIRNINKANDYFAEQDPSCQEAADLSKAFLEPIAEAIDPAVIKADGQTLAYLHEETLLAVNEQLKQANLPLFKFRQENVLIALLNSASDKGN